MKRFEPLLILLLPLLLGLYPLLYLYSINQAELTSGSLAQPLWLVALATTLLLGAARWFYKDWVKASLAVSLWWIGFFAYGQFTKLLDALLPAALSHQKFYLPLWLAGMVAFFYMLKRVKKVKPKTIGTLGAVAAGLMLIPLFKIATYSAHPTSNTDDYLQNNESRQLLSVNKEKLPNIYYLMLDSYPRSDSLKTYFGFDNSAFDNFLKRRGFSVLANSQSNYNQTWTSVPATMNMSYLKSRDQLAADQEKLSSRVLIDLYHHNKVLQYLQPAGYYWVHNSNLYSTQTNPAAEFNVRCGRSNEFAKTLLESTALKPFKLVTSQQRQNLREDSLCVMKNVAFGPHERPKFVFTHLLPPHPPYLFGADGQDVQETNLSLNSDTHWLAKKPYVAQLQYVNKRVGEALQGILDKDPEALIIIQSDHGTLSSATEAIKLEDMRPVVLKERSRNYVAIHLPNYCNKAQLKSLRTNVNTFRVIFNACFDAGYPLLEDHVYHGSDVRDKWQVFEDVTKETRD